MKTEAVLRAFAERTPRKDALVCEDRRVTYAELELRTNQIANALRARGIGSGDRVALFLDNGIAWVELFFGIMKCGAVTVPVSTRLTHHEIGVMLRDCEANACLCGDDRHDVAERAAASLELDLLRESHIYALAAEADDTAPPLPPPENDDCMINYTSGTTGVPKGAITTHSNMLIIAFLSNFDYGLRTTDSILVTTHFAHRTALGRLWNSITLGSTLVIMPRFDAAETLATIARESITVTGLVPTIARMLLEALDGQAASYSALRMLISVGESFPIELKRELFEKLPHVELNSAFGMTEAYGMAVLTSEYQISHAGSAGRPLPGVEVRLLDDAGNEVSAGEIGEITVRSGEPGRWMTMRGYYNNPEATAEVLREGWMHTGDMGRFDSRGFLYIVDRKKDMILSGALNIYSKEVENAILAHEAVRDAAVVGMPDATFGEAVAAFVELRAGRIATEGEIIEHCRELIASYKKPKRVFFEALPRNAQGKVLKHELRERIAMLVR
jgi:acyl-CoA synthetase (AMP-forming)/AMP-acid ligase II